jgi:hypothetical protein
MIARKCQKSWRGHDPEMSTETPHYTSKTMVYGIIDLREG